VAPVWGDARVRWPEVLRRGARRLDVGTLTEPKHRGVADVGALPLGVAGDGRDDLDDDNRSNDSVDDDEWALASSGVTPAGP
jgi:hypothetical protein